MKQLVLPNDVMLGEVKALLAEGHPVIILTKGFSMLPFIRGGRDSVLLEKTAELKAGDIALAEIAKGRYVLHRVIDVCDGVVTLRGDGNLRGTERCTQDAVAGIVKEIQPPKGKAVDPNTPGRQRCWRIWCRIPLIVRRGCLSILRRIY